MSTDLTLLVPDAWPDRLDLFNPYHVPAGSSRGGQFTSKAGGAGGGGGSGKAGSSAAQDALNQADPDARRNAWGALPESARDAFANAEVSVPARIAELLGAPDAPQTGKISADIDQRAAQFNALLPGSSGREVRSVANELATHLSAAGVSYADQHPLVMDALDTLAAQEYESLGRQLGDHGVRHLKGDADFARDLMRTVPGAETPADKVLVTLAAVYHDTGFLTEPSQAFLDEGHPRWSAEHYDANVRPLVEKALGKRAAGTLTHIIRTHDSTDINWQDDKIASAVRVADNLAVFQREKLPALFAYVKGNTAVLEQLGAKKLSLDAARQALHANIDASNNSGKIKTRLHLAADEVSGATAKYTLGMLSGEVDSFSWQANHVAVTLVRNKAADPQFKLLDLGQRQFAKLAKTYGVDPETFRTALDFEFKGRDGKTVLSATVRGYKAGVVLQEPA